MKNQEIQTMCFIKEQLKQLKQKKIRQKKCFHLKTKKYWNMSHRMPEIKPEHYITEEQCQKLIDKAIDRHNKTATVISAAIGSVLLFFYAHGVIAVVDKVSWK